MVVGLIAGLPEGHWSKGVTPMHSSVRRRRTCWFAKRSPGSFRMAQSGNCGCSRNPVPPETASLTRKADQPGSDNCLLPLPQLEIGESKGPGSALQRRRAIAQQTGRREGFARRPFSHPRHLTTPPVSANTRAQRNECYPRPDVREPHGGRLHAGNLRTHGQKREI